MALVHIDSDNVVAKVNDDNNIGASDIVFLDPLTCDDDDLEPNNDLSLATPIALNNGFVIVQDAVACPSYWPIGLPLTWKRLAQCPRFLRVRQQQRVTGCRGLGSDENRPSLQGYLDR